MPFIAPLVRPAVFHDRIQPQPDGRFAFARQGQDARLVNVPDDLGYYGDCVAWLPGGPVEWWMLERRIPILGAPKVMFAADVGSDLLLVESPRRYVEFACGDRWPGPTACVLDWQRPNAVRLWLSLVKAVRPESPTLAHAVKSVLDSEPARHRLRVRLAEPEKPASVAAPERVDLDQGTILEPFPVREPGAARLDTQREEAAE